MRILIYNLKRFLKLYIKDYKCYPQTFLKLWIIFVKTANWFYILLLCKLTAKVYILRQKFNINVK